MGVDSLDQNTPQFTLPNLSAQAQKFWISMKKASLGIRSPWSKLYISMLPPINVKSSSGIKFVTIHFLKNSYLIGWLFSYVEPIQEDIFKKIKYNIVT